MRDASAQLRITPCDLLYERRSSTLSSAVLANTSGYVLLEYFVPNNKNVIVYAVGSDQHQSSNYTWVFDGIILPISGPARPGSIEYPYKFPEPILISSSIYVFIQNANPVAYPSLAPGAPAATEDQFPYECVVEGRLESRRPGGQVS